MNNSSKLQVHGGPPSWDLDYDGLGYEKGYGKGFDKGFGKGFGKDFGKDPMGKDWGKGPMGKGKGLVKGGFRDSRDTGQTLRS